MSETTKLVEPTPEEIENRDRSKEPAPCLAGHTAYFNDDSDIGPAAKQVEHDVESPDLLGSPPDADLPFHKMSAEDVKLCESDIALALRIFKNEGEIFPVVFLRAPGANWYPYIFRMPATAEVPALVRRIHDLSRRDGVVGTYFNPNTLKQATQDEFQGLATDKSLTQSSRGIVRTDFDTIRYLNWDFDAHADTAETDNKDSSTVEEHAATREGVKLLQDHLKLKYGLPYPEVVSSGNGHQGFTALEPLTNDKPNRTLILTFQRRVMADLVDDFTKLGITFDPKVSRVESWMRLPGTPNRKGTGTAKRPHAVARILESPFVFREAFDGISSDILKDCREVSRDELEAIVGKPREVTADPNLLEADPERFVREYLSDDDAAAQEHAGFEDDDEEPARCWEFRCRWNKHADGGRKAFLIQRHDGKIRVGCHAAKCNVDAKGKPLVRTMAQLLDAVEPRWKSIPWLKLLTNPPPPIEFGQLASEIKPQFINWLWPKWIPHGMLTMLEGETSVSKSTLISEIIAHVTTGKPWDDGSPCKKGFVILCNTEENAAYKTIPRLIAAGADLSMVQIVESDFKLGGEPMAFTLPRDAKVLERIVNKHRATLVVIDVLFDVLHFKDATDSFVASAVRGRLQPLKALVHSTGCALLYVRHFNKDTGARLINRGGGSEAFTSFTRSVIAPRWWDEDDDQHEDPRRTLTCTKPVEERPRMKGYKVVGAKIDVEGQPLGTSRIEWLPADTALPSYKRKGPNANKFDAAVNFLEGTLNEDTWTLLTDLTERATREGITDGSLRRARFASGGPVIDVKKLTREEALPLGGKGGAFAWKLHKIDNGIF